MKSISRFEVDVEFLNFYFITKSLKFVVSNHVNIDWSLDLTLPLQGTYSNLHIVISMLEIQNVYMNIILICA